METLFPHVVTAADVPAIPGLRYLPNYVTGAAEWALAGRIDARPWNTEWRRRRQPYGGGYGTKGAAPPIPDWGRRLADRLFADGITDRPFDHMLVNEYLPGQGIAPHRDYAPFGRTVVSLSLLSACVMDFRHPRDRPPGAAPPGAAEPAGAGRRGPVRVGARDRPAEGGRLARAAGGCRRRLSVTLRFRAAGAGP